MCDFKPGDEIVCVDAAARHEPCNLKKGAVYTVECVRIDPQGALGVWVLESRSCGWKGGYFANRFRKVQKRDLTAWLSTASKDTNHLDQSARGKKEKAR